MGQAGIHGRLECRQEPVLRPAGDRTRGRHDKAMDWLVRNPRNGIETNFLFPV